MDPRKIDADVELLAEVLLTNPRVVSESYKNAATEAATAYQNAVAKSLEPFGKKLDDLYRDQLQYPKDLGDYSRLAGSDMVDPWLQPYDVRFTVKQAEDVMELWSAGPDKVRGTDDDFVVWQMRRKWFARFESLMEMRSRSWKIIRLRNRSLCRDSKRRAYILRRFAPLAFAIASAIALMSEIDVR